MVTLGFWQGLALGFGAAIPIGPVNVEIIRRGLAGGFAPAFSLGLGAASADTVYVTLLMAGLGQAAGWPPLQAGLSLFAAVFLGLLGSRGLRGAWATWRRQARPSWAVLKSPANVRPALEPGAAQPVSRVQVGLRNYLTGLAMTLFNPYTIGFWLSVSGVASGRGSGGWSIAVGVIVATVSWVIGLSSALHVGRIFSTPATLALVDALGGAVMLGFAGRAAWVFGSSVII